MLESLDLGNLRIELTRTLEQFVQQRRRCRESLRELGEQVVELFVPRQDPHGSLSGINVKTPLGVLLAENLPGREAFHYQVPILEQFHQRYSGEEAAHVRPHCNAPR